MNISFKAQSLTLSQQINSKLEKEIEDKKQSGSLRVLMLGALGVVFGDIGTSPLYAIRESFMHTGVAVDAPNIYRFLSMIFWLLFIVVTAKYVTFVMRANNKGEGGDFALLALVQRLTRPNPQLFHIVGILGIAAGSLFYADAVITPAISVLSAVEGLKVVAPAFDDYVVPLTLIIIISLFSVQKHGTGAVGIAFGPIMLIWFASLGFLGMSHILQEPSVIKAINPYYALEFIIDYPHIAFLGMGSTVLAVTGAEALYADMGHFGATPIKRAWFFVVWPCLLLNYFGQGALLMKHPEAIENPFFLMAPKSLSMPLLILAAISTIIASQAVISGAFSLTKQAIHLGYLPRMKIYHTSEKEVGQVYLPFINWLLLITVIMVVLIFKSSSGLAAAYGLAVTGAMSIASILVATVMRLKWHWQIWKIAIVIGGFLAVDLTLFASASTKLFTGGYVPLMIAIVIFTILTTWKRGKEILGEKVENETISIDTFVEDTAKNPPIRVPGTAIYMTSRHNAVPSALLQNMKHNKVLHERVIFLTVVSQEFPYISQENSVHLYELGSDIYKLDVLTGFKDIPDVPAALQYCHDRGMDFDPIENTSFFMCIENVVPKKNGEGMAFWREHLFTILKNNASSAPNFFKLPSDRVCELGTMYEM